MPIIIHAIIPIISAQPAAGSNTRLAEGERHSPIEVPVIDLNPLFVAYAAERESATAA